MSHNRRASDRVKPRDVETEPVELAIPDSSVIVQYAPSLVAAGIVFAVATAAHGLLTEWASHLAYRAVPALLVTGICWRRFQGSRLRAMTIGGVAYTAAFAPSHDFGVAETAFALFLGLVVVVVGAGLLGVQRDEFGAHKL